MHAFLGHAIIFVPTPVYVLQWEKTRLTLREQKLREKNSGDGEIRISDYWRHCELTDK